MTGGARRPSIHGKSFEGTLVRISGTLISLLGAGLAVAFAGCVETIEPDDGRAYADFIWEKANAFAESEMARMAAADMLYRDRTRLFESNVPVLGTPTGLYTKVYRHFTDYEVSDITQSESILNPVAFHIRFDYEVVSSPLRRYELEGAPELSQADRDHYILEGRSLERIYLCDEAGNPSRKAWEPLPPFDFYARDRDGSVHRETIRP